MSDTPENGSWFGMDRMHDCRSIALKIPVIRQLNDPGNSMLGQRIIEFPEVSPLDDDVHALRSSEAKPKTVALALR